MDIGYERAIEGLIERHCKETPPAALVLLASDYRIPVDDGYTTCWVTALHFKSEVPSPKELEQLRLYTEYKVRQVYTPTYQRIMLEDRPFPGDPGHNTVTFRREPSGDWSYRRATWERGPSWVRHDGSLLDLLDRIEAVGGTLPAAWEAWKDAHEVLQ